MKPDNDPALKTLHERSNRPLVRRSMVAYGETMAWPPIEEWGTAQLYEAWAVVYEIHNVIRDEMDTLDCCSGCTAAKPCQICTLHERLKA